jgi:ribosomal protein L21E
MSKNRRRRNGAVSHAQPGSTPHQPQDAVRGSAGASEARRASAEQATLLLGLISSGALDDHLALLTRVIGQRQRHLLDAASVRALAALDVGDRVRVNRHVRPLYLQGSTGTVTGWSGRSVIVSLDEPSGRFAEVRCHPIGLDRLGG